MHTFDNYIKRGFSEIRSWYTVRSVLLFPECMGIIFIFSIKKQGPNLSISRKRTNIADILAEINQSQVNDSERKG